MNVSKKHKSWKSRWVPDYRLKVELVFCLTLFLKGALLAQNINGGDGSHYSVLVESLISGEIRERHNENLLMTPASTLKVVSSAMALETLGADFRFTTGIYTNGAIDKGTLLGDLIIKGGGDGTLGSTYFSETSAEQILAQIQQKLQGAGIKQLEGSIWLDQSLFPENHYPDGRLWEDMANYYGAPPSAISWRDNSFDVFLKSPHLIGALCDVTGTAPIMSAINFKSSVIAASGGKDSAYIYGYPGLTDWEVRGSIPAGRSSFRIKGAMPFPGIRFGEELAMLFSDEPLEVLIANDAFDYNKFEKITEWASPPVGQIIQVVNRRSHNLLADHLFLAAGLTANGSYGWEASRSYFRRFWAKRLSLPPIRVLDGSGLSPKNLVSARFMVDVLKYVHQSPNFDVFKSSLAVGGQSGTLAHMWKAPSLKGRVIAKSGFMEGTLAYCGYLYTHKGDVLAFSIMVNNMTNDLPTVRKSIESYVSDLITLY